MTPDEKSGSQRKILVRPWNEVEAAMRAFNTLLHLLQTGDELESWLQLRAEWEALLARGGEFDVANYPESRHFRGWVGRLEVLRIKEELDESEEAEDLLFETTRGIPALRTLLLRYILNPECFQVLQTLAEDLLKRLQLGPPYSWYLQRLLLDRVASRVLGIRHTVFREQVSENLVLPVFRREVVYNPPAAVSGPKLRQSFKEYGDKVAKELAVYYGVGRSGQQPERIKRDVARMYLKRLAGLSDKQILLALPHRREDEDEVRRSIKRAHDLLRLAPQVVRVRVRGSGRKTRPR